MVTPTKGIHLGRAAKLAHADNERRLKQSTVSKVGNQRGEGFVQRRYQPAFTGLVIIRVGIPARVVDRYKADTRFHETPRKETSLTDLRATILVTDFWFFILELKCRLGLWA